MTKVFYVYYEDEWEAEGFFDANGRLLACWSRNDADWRSEYMNPLLEELGFKVVTSKNKTLIEKLRRHTGG
jgi:hypothetical protein